MRKIKKRSAVPLYGTAALWALYCLLFPLYRLSDLLILVGLSLGVYALLTKLFPGTVVEVKVPVSTGDAQLDELLRQGDEAVSNMKRIRASINSPAVAEKVDRLINVTEKIFEDVKNDPGDAPQVRRFASYYLPTTIKLLDSYVRMNSQEVTGENIDATLKRIEEILNTTVTAYEKQLDALFADQALDIETDITVLETMLKREGLTGKDF